MSHVNLCKSTGYVQAQFTSLALSHKGHALCSDGSGRVIAVLVVHEMEGTPHVGATVGQHRTSRLATPDSVHAVPIPVANVHTTILKKKSKESTATRRQASDENKRKAQIRAWSRNPLR
jgi:hypothetical protein